MVHGGGPPLRWGLVWALNHGVSRVGGDLNEVNKILTEGDRRTAESRNGDTCGTGGLQSPLVTVEHDRCSQKGMLWVFLEKEVRIEEELRKWVGITGQWRI